MAGDIDELFGEGSGQPQPRSTLTLGLLSAGVVLAVLGLACTAAPGGVLVLLAWMVVEKELDRVESGYLPVDVKPRLVVLQRLAYACLLFVIAVFVLQGFLFCNGFYEMLWAQMLSWVLG